MYLWLHRLSTCKTGSAGDAAQIWLTRKGYNHLHRVTDAESINYPRWGEAWISQSLWQIIKLSAVRRGDVCWDLRGTRRAGMIGLMCDWISQSQIKLPAVRQGDGMWDCEWISQSLRRRVKLPAVRRGVWVCKPMDLRSVKSWSNCLPGALNGRLSLQRNKFTVCGCELGIECILRRSDRSQWIAG